MRTMPKILNGCYADTHGGQFLYASRFNHRLLCAQFPTGKQHLKERKNLMALLANVYLQTKENCAHLR
jgi:hypothetical protein